ncbi:malto-oligosyltrehalose synthase [Anaeromyxobacter sp. Fw109-5]|uniref:malto-oligosyltrehalose synthase n=1 Tax=Anaeromyxobacter sp. (strain Fw109-5) TaxID=404589 RepID=UPI0000ED79D8|nr:malto-oligosyltrehalose synthase [Anaeromyxobacter sp. Fw109-5]ABS24533.1 malto-oligosyltrehalose synthase [Anaeromyxobacter sp. Fw109-5]
MASAAETAATERVALAAELVEALAQEAARGEGSTRRPASTYRLQLHGGFGFEDAARVVPYLHALGVSDLYVSPILEAAPGSTHGYDVVNHGRLNPELGGEEGFLRLAGACAQRGMGILVDFVPNHMGIGPRNAWWMDVLENGPSSVHARAFDVEWRPLKAELGHKVLVPLLGDQFGKVLERGELQLAREGGALVVRYWDHVFPVAPRSVPQLLRHRLDELRGELGPGDVHYQELESICVSLEKLAPRTDTSPQAVADRAREKEVAKRRLASLCEASPRVRAFVDENIRIFNGRKSERRSFDLLEKLLEGQAYRLAFWRVAGEEINYRRFFDVNALAAIRMEEPRVFQEAHRLVLGLLRDGRISGLRIDHPDGLYAPPAYFRRLQASYLVERARALAARRGTPLEPDTEALVLERVFEALEAGRLPPRPLYVVVEKILIAPERMPDGWDVDGTTGYEFLAAVNGLFVEPEAERAFDGMWARLSGRREQFADVVADKKRLVMSSSMAGEVNMLAHRLNRISEMNRRTRDFTLNELTRALVEFVALFPVYRTYVTRRGEVDDRDRALVERTIARARRRSPVVDPSIYDFLRDVVLQRYPEELTEDERREWLELTLKLQQITGPVTAKAVEDTAFYTYVRLVSLNEVGGEPRHFGTTPEEVHGLLSERQARFPGSLSSTSTHDTKRSEDVRVRIDALSEIPTEWRAAVLRWHRMNRAHVGGEGGGAPDRADELLLYQTLVGALPDGGVTPGTRAHADFVGRIQGYMEKALREAKVHTSWTSPNEDYEAGVRTFVERILASPAFLADLGAFSARVAAVGRLSSLAQVAVKCAAPGVPDVYQGCELWDLSLVDPDNRRPVDYALRAQTLEALRADLARGPAARRDLARSVSAPETLADGRAKLLLLHAALHARREQRELFLAGDYRPAHAEGPHARSVFAFARAHAGNGGRAALCVVPRLVLGLLEAGGGRIRWEGALEVPHGLPRRWRDVVTGARREGDALPLAELFEDFPVAVLVSE